MNTLTGGKGDDRLDGGFGGDTLDGGIGVDTISYSARTDTDRVVVKLDGFRNDGSDPNASGQSGMTEEGDFDIDIENAVGGAGPDRLVGNTLLNILTGGAGDDRIEARDGTELVDQLVCGIGTDSFTADSSDTRTACETALP